MPRLTLFTPIFLLALLLASATEGLTGPAGRQVVTVRPRDISTVNRKSCRVRPTSGLNATSSAALPSFSAEPSVVASSSHSAAPLTSHILAPIPTSRFVTSIRSATSPPPPSPTPEQPKPSPSPVQVNKATTEAPTTSQAPPSPPPAPPKTTSTPAPPSTQSSSGSTSSSDIDQYLSAHNTIRAQHGASALTWSDELASKAQQWANGCVFQHSGGSLGPFGENLAAGTGSSYDITAAVKSWTDEVSEYDPNNPVPSHFTQVVWKASTQVGCAVSQCNGIFAASFGLAKFFVCEYSPQGNVIGEFAQNVQV
ncbi:PR-1-like protein [Phanerochaete sordida]|uniref:PR-1-like protein n=1 Tax=Phanerochaete sordida TaxID=48140 RepID=A0A9P3G0M6_9APHY|nr:PR-1-like protein [Phanerochaete sordida]